MKSEHELNHCLIDRLKEELRDVESYSNLYNDLVKAGMIYAAEIIEDIARDEYSHAKAISATVETEDDSEVHSLWEKAHSAFDIKE